MADPLIPPRRIAPLLIGGVWLVLLWRGSIIRTASLALTLLDTFRALRIVRVNGRRIGIASRRKAMRSCLKCWIVLLVMESSLAVPDYLLGWIPFYAPVKVVLMLVFLAVRSQASTSMYTSLIRPTVKRYELPIDLSLLFVHSLSTLLGHFTVLLPLHTIKYSLRAPFERVVVAVDAMLPRRNPALGDDAVSLEHDRVRAARDMMTPGPALPGRYLRTAQAQRLLRQGEPAAHRPLAGDDEEYRYPELVSRPAVRPATIPRGAAAPVIRVETDSDSDSDMPQHIPAPALTPRTPKRRAPHTNLLAVPEGVQTLRRSPRGTTPRSDVDADADERRAETLLAKLIAVDVPLESVRDPTADAKDNDTPEVVQRRAGPANLPSRVHGRDVPPADARAPTLASALDRHKPAQQARVRAGLSVASVRPTSSATSIRAKASTSTGKTAPPTPRKKTSARSKTLAASKPPLSAPLAPPRKPRSGAPKESHSASTAVGGAGPSTDRNGLGPPARTRAPRPMVTTSGDAVRPVLASKRGGGASAEPVTGSSVGVRGKGTAVPPSDAPEPHAKRRRKE